MPTAMDQKTILDSVKKTNRLVILEEAWPFGNVATEITYQVQEQAFDYLDAPDYKDQRRVTIRTKLNLSSGQPIPINYVMQRSGESWKIIDVVIEGISLVISNRTQFGTSISRDGLDTVIAKLEYKQTEQETE